ncbi:MAG: hypothetical protein MR446_04665, partial [Bacteroidales bacterium]|nr:hypothetical protein [Bacteroidales bacterium]
FLRSIYFRRGGGLSEQAAVEETSHGMGTFFHGGDTFSHGISLTETASSMRLPDTCIFCRPSNKFSGQ